MGNRKNLTDAELAASYGAPCFSELNFLLQLHFLHLSSRRRTAKSNKLFQFFQLWYITECTQYRHDGSNLLVMLLPSSDPPSLRPDSGDLLPGSHMRGLGAFVMIFACINKNLNSLLWFLLIQAKIITNASKTADFSCFSGFKVCLFFLKQSLVYLRPIYTPFTHH